MIFAEIRHIVARKTSKSVREIVADFSVKPYFAYYDK